MLSRRAASTLIAAMVLAPPWDAVAQDGRARPARIGLLINGSPGAPLTELVLARTREAFARLGYVDGTRLLFEPRFAEGRLDRLPALASDLVRADADVILAFGGPAARAAKDAAGDRPIVFSIVTDPVALRLVAAMDRPGGNATGVTSLDPEHAPKQYGLLKDIVPHVERVAILSDGTIPGADASGLAPIERAHDAAARALGLQPKVFRLTSAANPELERAFADMKSAGAQALVVLETPVPILHRKRVGELARQNGLPAIFFGGAADAEGLVSYGTTVADTWPMMPPIADRILKGERPGEIPVAVASRNELVVNLNTAQALGLSVPAEILKRADRVVK